MNNIAYEEKIAAIRLLSTPNIGCKIFMQLISLYEDPLNIIYILSKNPKIYGKNIKLCSKEKAILEYKNVKDIGGDILYYKEEKYPKMLKLIDDFPPIITILGNVELLDKPSIAIVGSRNASLNAKKITQYLISGLKKYNYNIISGLARGIDTIAHQESLNTGTIAVIANGIDKIYPPENKDLMSKIKENGVIISENFLGTLPKSQYFPRRNRIISALSVGVVIVEAAIKSGSLITAKYALEQGKEIFAVPGSPLDIRCQGTNKLIKEGAILTESYQDILDYFSISNNNFIDDTPKIKILDKDILQKDDLDTVRIKIYKSLGPSPVFVDDIIRESKLLPNIVNSILLEFELEGKIDRLSGNQVVLLTH